MNDFFPNPGFAWVFVLALWSVLVAASYLDLRHLLIPNWLTVPTLAAGFLVNIVRLGWVGSHHDEALWGALWGLLFSLLGFALGFGLFVVFWLMGLCGAGDVKLFAAVASWLGWRCSFWVWLVSFFLVALMATIYGLMRMQSRQLHESETGRPQDVEPAAADVKLRKGLLPYALPLTVAAVVVCSWFFRADLKLVDGGAKKGYSALRGFVPAPKMGQTA